MSIDKQQGNFDEILGHALRQHREQVPSDFTQNILKQIKNLDQQEILSKLVLQEGLALAGGVAMGIIALIAAAVFSTSAASLILYAGGFLTKSFEGFETLCRHWQTCLIFIALLGFVVYSLSEFLFEEN